MRSTPAEAREGRYRAGVALLTLVALLLSAGWALMLPFFDGPDENRHLNSVARLIDGGGWPRPYDAPVLGSVREAVIESGTSSLVRPTVLPAPDERRTLLGGSEVPDSGRDAMVQHPPGYYAVAAIIVSAFGGGDLRWDQALLVMRLSSAVILAAAVPFVVGTARRVAGSRVAGLLGGIGVLAVPAFAIGGGYASNDVLLVTASSAALYLLVRACADPRAGAALPALAGAAYGVALLTKGLALMMAPAVVVLALVAAHRRGWSVRTVLTGLVAPAALAGLIGGWWWVRNLFVLGVLQPSQYGSRAHSETAAEGYDPIAFVTGFLSRLNATFWGRGTDPATAFPDALLVALALGLVVVVFVALALGPRRFMLAVLLSYPAIIAVTLFVNAHGIYWDLGLPDRGVQARYLFGGAAAFAAAFAGFAVVARTRLGRAGRAVATAAGILPLVSAAAAAWWILPPTWAPLTDAFGVAPPGFMGVSLGLLVLIAVAAVLASGALAVVLWLLAPVVPARRGRDPRSRVD